MKPSTTLALSALLAFVSATPVDKRDPTRTTVTTTETDVVTVDVYITMSGSPPTSSSAVAADKHADHVAYHINNKAYAKNSPAPTPSSSSSTPTPAPPATSASQQQPSAASAAGGSPEDIQNAAIAKQEAVNQQQANINNAQKSADFAHQSSMGVLQNGGGGGGGGDSSPGPTSAPPAFQASAPSSQAPASAAPSASPPSTSGGGGGGGGSCGSVGGSCSGDVTIYNDQGLGACGWNNDTNSQDFFALAAPMFGTYTNDAPGPHKNAFCGRMANIVVGGKTFSGMLTDRCGGCVGQSIDLSQHLFSQLYPNEPPGNGRYHDVQWSFADQGPYHGAS